MRTLRPLKTVGFSTAVRLSAILLTIGAAGTFDAARVDAQAVIGDSIPGAAFAALALLPGGVEGATVARLVAATSDVPRAKATMPLVVDPISGVPQWTAEVVDSRSTSATVPGVLLQPTTYASALNALAVAVAARTGADAAGLSAVWQRTGTVRMTVVLTALAQVGTPYRYGGNAPGGFDCSGLTSYSWAAAGVRIPRTSTDQIAAVSPLPATALQPGDLVWRPGHIGMAIGIDDLMVNATQTGKPVEVKRWGRVVRTGSPSLT